MKTIIIYASTHHGNTEKVVQAMAESMGADMVDITKRIVPNIAEYDRIGLASGVYFHSLHKKILQFAEEASFLQTQRFFLVDTCGIAYRDYTRPVKKILAQKGVCCIGHFQCRGLDTFGIFGKMGGIAKGHPNARDLSRAQQFAQRMAL